MTQPMTEQLTTPIEPRSIGTGVRRVDGVAKVTGRATYAVEHRGSETPLHLWLVQSQVPRGRITRVDTDAALAHGGVVAVLDHTNAPRLADTSDGELAILQDEQVHFRGQIVAVVVAETPEAAREGAALVHVDVAAADHEVDMAAALDDAYTPDKVNPAYPTDTDEGDVEAGLAEADVVVEQTYRTPFEHNNPMEPHALVARWEEREDGPFLDLFDSTQGVHGVRRTLAPLLGLKPEQVRVRAPYVGGGFGSKGLPHSPEVAAVLAAQTTGGRPVKLAVTRQQMFALTGYRTATVSRFRLGAKPDGTLVAIDHRVVEQTSRVKEFAEQTATATRMMYAAPHRHTSHRLIPLDVAVPSWMRAPGEMPGVFAHEVAMDELAVACGIDPILLRERNEPEVDPESGKPFGNRRLLDCLARGAERFGWADRPAEPRATLDGDWWVGTGVASATYPAYTMPGNAARIASLEGGRYAVAIGAVDVGTGARTVLAQIAADALGVDLGRRRARDRRLPAAPGLGRGRLVRHQLVGWRDRRRRAAVPRRPRRAPGPGRRDDRLGRQGPGDVAARAALVRRVLRRGPGQPVHRRDPGAPAARRLLGRPGHQPGHRTLAVPRRPGDGPVRRAVRGGVPRPAVRAHRDPGPGQLPRRVARGRARRRGRVARRGGHHRVPDGRPRDR